MRFVFAVLGLTLFASSVVPAASTQTSDARDVAISYEASPILQTVQKRRRSGSEKPVVDPKLKADVFAGGLGDISALAMDNTGVIYAADQKRGRIFLLTDRAKDGRLDMRRVVASGLDQPTGLAVAGDKLYIADARAVWETSLQGGKLTLAVDLTNSGALPTPRLLWPSADGRSLILAVSHLSPEPTGRIVSVDIETGQAGLIAQGAGPVSALAVGINDMIWVGVGNRILPVRGGEFLAKSGARLGANTDVTGLALPGQFPNMPSFMEAWNDHIFASQGGLKRPGIGHSGGFNVLAVPTRFGQPSDGVEKFADGFTGRSGRAAWGEPGAVLIDERGMFITDKWGGNIWLIRKAPPVPENIAMMDSESLVKENEPETDPLPRAEIQPRGSSIAVGSKIEFGSSITTGSKIPEPPETTSPETDANAPEPE